MEKKIVIEEIDGVVTFKSIGFNKNEIIGILQVELSFHISTINPNKIVDKPVTDTKAP